LGIDPHQTTTFEPALLARIRALDAVHRVAVDPGLGPTRAAMLAHCRANGTILLLGSPATGRSDLAHWAHARLADVPLTVTSPGRPARTTAGAWQLFENIEELSAAELEPLGRSLSAEADYGRIRPNAPKGMGLRPAHPAFQNIVGESAALTDVLTRAERYAPSTLAVLVRGPTGAGKELLARAVHDASGRKGRYVAIDLNAQPEGLVEAALFGHVKGAFTGADKDRLGAFREAQGGTIFIDELGNLSPAVQVRLLRVLETRTVQPVGSDKVFPFDARLIAATNADLEEMVRRGEFREDLLFRFNPSATLHLPALAERREDVLVLASRFAAMQRGDALPADWISPEAAHALEKWDWPGNIRELRHVMEAAAVEAGNGRVELNHLGYVNPELNVPRPRIATAADGEGDIGGDWKLARSARRLLAAVTIRVPRLADRGALAVRSAVLHALGGRPILPDALGLLEKRAWWGDFTELDRAMAALRQGPPGVVDTPRLLEVLPDLQPSESLVPILVLMHPTRAPDGSLSGLRQSFAQGALLIGRTHRLADLEVGPNADERTVERSRAMKRLLGTARPGLLCLDNLASLSRAHCLIVRDEGALMAHLLPNARMPTFAGPLGSPLLSPLTAGEPVALGEAGVIELRFGGDPANVQRIYLFAGEVALADKQHHLLQSRGGSVTMGGTDPDISVRVWSLNPTERGALATLLLEAADRGGAIAQRIREGSQTLSRSPELSTLARYLHSAHPTQSAVRLVQHEANSAVAQELSQGLNTLASPSEAWARLPKGIRDLVPAPTQVGVNS
jgi:transcriptional regulator with AAA-type ATPase domain